jgi:rod shape-determining protein MreC
MAWYGRRRSGEQRVGARAAVVGIGVAMVGVLAIQTSSAIREGLDAPRESADATTAELAGFARGALGWSIGFGYDKAAAARIAELEAQVRDLERWKEMAETMVVRMRRYETLLGLVGETQAPAVIARVVAEERGPFAATRIANAGASDGVREGFAVINEHGLIGRVIRVGEHTSRILLVTDFNSRVPVMGSQSQDRALLVGDNGVGARLLEPETPDRIVPGEIWITSGDDGQIPLGVPVGRARLENGEWRVDLAMHDGPVDFVRLAPPPDFATPEAAPATTPPAARPVAARAPPAEPPPAAAPRPAPRPAARPASPRTDPAPGAGANAAGAPPVTPPASTGGGGLP